MIVEPFRKVPWPRVEAGLLTREVSADQVRRVQVALRATRESEVSYQDVLAADHNGKDNRDVWANLSDTFQEILDNDAVEVAPAGRLYRGLITTLEQLQGHLGSVMTPPPIHQEVGGWRTADRRREPLRGLHDG